MLSIMTMILSLCVQASLCCLDDDYNDNYGSIDVAASIICLHRMPSCKMWSKWISKKNVKNGCPKCWPSTPFFNLIRCPVCFALSTSYFILNIDSVQVCCFFSFHTGFVDVSEVSFKPLRGWVTWIRVFLWFWENLWVGLCMCRPHNVKTWQKKSTIKCYVGDMLGWEWRRRDSKSTSEHMQKTHAKLSIFRTHAKLSISITPVFPASGIIKASFMYGWHFYCLDIPFDFKKKQLDQDSNVWVIR